MDLVQGPVRHDINFSTSAGYNTPQAQCISPTGMLAADLFITAEIWKQQRHPSVGEEVSELGYVQALRDHLVLKRKQQMKPREDLKPRVLQPVASWLPAVSPTLPKLIG